MTSPEVRREARLARPGSRRRGSDVLRTRVLDLLDEHRDVPVVSVEAPGGFGKTTVVGQWAERDGRPLVWITVRPQAPDATWLAHEVVDGLHRVGACETPVTLPEALDAVAWHLGLLPVVEQAVAGARGPFLLVVDEVGALEGPAWDGLAASIAASLPPGCQLVLSGRREAPPSLRRLRAAGQLVSLGPEVLALDAVEGDAILRSLGLDLDQAAVLDVLERTGGWPIALPLVASALRSKRGRRGGRLVTTQALADYLRHEVLEQLDPADASLLLRCSVLPDLDGPTCDAVTGRPGSLARLRRLSAATHLLAPSDGSEERFRLHPLFAEFLDEELRAADPEGWRSAHLAAAASAEHDGDLDSAVLHLRAAGDDATLGQLAWQAGGVLLGSGRGAVLRRWLEGIPDDRLARIPRLALTAAWVASQEGNLPRMERLRLAAHVTAAEEDPDFLLEVGLLDATVGADGLEAIGEAARRFLDARRDTPWLTLAHLLRGVAATLLGDTEVAGDVLELGRRTCQAWEMPLMEAHCLTGIADLALLADDREGAMRAVRAARQLAEDHRLDVIATAAPIFTTSAYGYVLEGRMADAQAESGRALRLTSLMREMAPWHAVQGRLALANVALAVGDVGRAQELFSEAERAAGPAAESPVLDQARDRLRERLRSLSSQVAGGPALTTAEVRVLQYLPTHLSFPEIAAELFVSRHTVKTQALSAYRKLGAHTRSEAIEKARERGLLPPR